MHDDCMQDAYMPDAIAGTWKKELVMHSKTNPILVHVIFIGETTCQTEITQFRHVSFRNQHVSSGNISMYQLERKEDFSIMGLLPKCTLYTDEK